jgi:hypothetical protein
LNAKNNEVAIETLEIVGDPRHASRFVGALVLDGDRDPARRLAREVAGCRVQQRADAAARAEELDAPEQGELRHVATLDVDERRVERAVDVQRRPAG